MNTNPTTSNNLWRSLAKGSEDRALGRRDEFMPGASDFENFDRRAFLKLMGASIALASLPACTRQPPEKLVPYVNQPEQLIPGKPLYFATAMAAGGFTTGLIAESHEGHPTKLEGNRDHPASLGATGIFQQAALLDLYDPDRSKTILNSGKASSWAAFTAMLDGHLKGQSAKGGIRILTGTVTSPTLHAQIDALLKKHPTAVWHQYEPINRDNVKEGARMAFGDFFETHYDFTRAKTILSLDADFLYSHPNSLRYTRDFASLRRARFGRADMSRLYAVESTPTITGANADHRLPLAWSAIAGFAIRLAQILNPGAGNNGAGPLAPENWMASLARDLASSEGESIVIAGENQPSIVHALAHTMNSRLGNFGKTITFTAPAEAKPVVQIQSLRELVDALNSGTVGTLLILGGNPIFNAPADFDFATAMGRASLRIHLNPDVNETSRASDWHIPENHFLESWGDGRAFDGTVSIIQPLILPLYDGKSAHEILDHILTGSDHSDYDIVRDYWKSANQGDDFEARWRKALHDGLIPDSALPVKTVSLRPFDIPVPAAENEDLELTFRADPTIGDGRHANNGWLQELPKPITKLVWDNAAYISDAFAQRKGLQNGDVIEITSHGRKLNAPVWIVPGQPKNSIGLQFGYGRAVVGNVGSGAGCNPYLLRTSPSPWATGQVEIRKTGRRYRLISTQDLHTIDSDDRQILRVGNFAEFQATPDFVQKQSETPTETLFDPKAFKYDGYRWGMAIDLGACTGCSACTLACQAENNIPVVGKTEVGRGRIMHWIRVDGYFRGGADNPQITHQPVPCMHCENAPCELVCPVGATIHDKEGLNLQVYNRCVGTRYCSNNCPYKVRRFNFFQYADYKTPSLRPMWNPNVTVRWRGVMEKCTYCIQRISLARITSEEQGRKIADGEIRTACQQACPAHAIVFGDLSDPNSAVSKIKNHPLNYLMLGQLNTRPRTTYLAKLRNPNPALAS